MLQTLFGYDVMDTGLLMMPRGLAMLAGMILTNQMIGKVDNRYLMTFGFVTTAIGAYAMSGWSLGMDRTPIILAGMMQGFGTGFIFVPATLVAFATVAPRLRPDGTSLLNLTRNIGSSIGISLMITYLTRNAAVVHDSMVGHVTSFNLPAVDVSAVAAAYPQIGVTALAAIDGEMTRQSLMLAYIDNFYALFWIMLVFAPLMLLVPRNRH
jgi:DHA2 family multidrug resistance protein